MSDTGGGGNSLDEDPDNITEVDITIPIDDFIALDAALANAGVGEDPAITRDANFTGSTSTATVSLENATALRTALKNFLSQTDMATFTAIDRNG